jgi:hypothetical protein
MAFQIERGTFSAVALGGLGFILVGPGPMGHSNWSVGLVIDDASTDQRVAITTIASSAGGGPMAALSLIDEFLGDKSSPIASSATA